ncbi:MAG: phosphoribosylanthranilate isomerase [Thiotrichales bacterium]|nr:phosphoribosylanthranilate isomerase [Thiotrichales bacterium]
MSLFDDDNARHTRVKICGITRAGDGQAAAAAGADAIGLVFYPDSPRAVSAKQARCIASELPASISRVGLFVDASETSIRSALAECPLDVLQFHGQEDVAQCERYGLPYIKAIKARDRQQIEQQMRAFPSASAILLDTWDKDLAGGTGQLFDWSLIPETREKPLILAGGLNPDNVRFAVQQVRPYAVDVSGGVEASKGIKDHDRINMFINEVKHAVIG